MPSVGSISLTRLSGTLHPPQRRMKVLERGGVDDFGLKEGPARALASQLTGWVDVADAAAAETLKTDLASVIGTKVTITDELGQSHPKCWVIDARLTRAPQARVVLEGGFLQDRLRCFVALLVQQHSE